MSNTPDAIDPSDPNLQQASQRLQRVEWVWAALFLGMGLLSWFTLGLNYPLTPIPWLLTALLLAITRQPAALAMVAIIWGLSLISIIPGFALVFGPDPISEVFSGGTVETVGRAAVRIVLAIAAWNQFLMYRMLYGTSGSSGLPENLPDIPEVISNETKWFALGSLLAGSIGLAADVGSLLPLTTQTSLLLAQAGVNLGLLAIGAGLGATFSPISDRRTALFGLLLGTLSFLGAMAVGSLLLS